MSFTMIEKPVNFPPITNNKIHKKRLQKKLKTQ